MGIPFPSRVQTSLCIVGCVWPSAGVYVIMLGWSHTAFAGECVIMLGQSTASPCPSAEEAHDVVECLWRVSSPILTP